MGEQGVTAVILAGGSSKRMGSNKALLKLGEETMIEKTVNPLRQVFDEIIVITDIPEAYGFLEGVKFFSDEFQMEEKNSMIGIYTGLLKAAYPNVFVVACDMPFLNKELLLYMKDKLQGEVDILIPYVNGFYEPLHAVYSKNCLPVFEECLKQKRYKVTATFDRLRVNKVEESKVREYDSELKSFININTFEEYSKTCQLFELDSGRLNTV